MARLIRSFRFALALLLAGPAAGWVAGAAAVPAAGAETTVPAAPLTLRPSVLVEDPVIRLRDLFAGPVANGATPIARAPAPGESVVLDARWLAALASAYELPWRPASRFEQTVVARASQKIGAAEIRQALHAAAAARGIEGPVEIALDGGGAGFHMPVDLPPTIKVEKLSLDRASGRFVALVTAPADGPAVARSTVSGRLFPLVEVPVAARRLSPGEIIGRDDLEWKAVRADRITRNTALDADQLLGKSPRRPLRPGEPILHTEVRRAVLVAKGSTVTMTLEKPRMSLSVRGRALQDGARGDVVRVMNTKSNRIVEAVVVETGLVVVAAGEPPVSK